MVNATAAWAAWRHTGHRRALIRLARWVHGMHVEDVAMVTGGLLRSNALWISVERLEYGMWSRRPNWSVMTMAGELNPDAAARSNNPAVYRWIAYDREYRTLVARWQINERPSGLVLHSEDMLTPEKERADA